MRALGDADYAETQGVFRAPRRATSPPANDARTSWPEMANSGMLQSVSPAMERSGLEYWQSVPPPTPQMDPTGSTLASIHARPNVMGSMLSSGPSSIATTTAIDWRVPSTPPQATGFLPLYRSPLDPSNTSDDFGGSLESAELSSVSPPVRLALSGLDKVHVQPAAPCLKLRSMLIRVPTDTWRTSNSSTPSCLSSTERGSRPP